MKKSKSTKIVVQGTAIRSSDRLSKSPTYILKY